MRIKIAYRLSFTYHEKPRLGIVKRLDYVGERLKFLLQSQEEGFKSFYESNVQGPIRVLNFDCPLCGYTLGHHSLGETVRFSGSHWCPRCKSKILWDGIEWRLTNGKS